MNMKIISTYHSKVNINNNIYDVDIIYKKGKKNITFRFKNNKFIITSPNKILPNDLINKLLKYGDKLIKKSSIPQLISKDYVYILGIKINIKNVNYIKFKNDSYLYFDNLDDLKNKLNDKFYALAKQYLQYYQSLMNINEDLKLKTSYLKTRYGSFSKKTNTVSLNTILYHYDIEYLKSVIVHELAHYYQMNHSKSFYQIVYKYYPNYKIIHNRLKRGIVDGNN